jgi:cell division septation protein DedD
MLQKSDGETEILLGNKQLLGIFFVVVVLLGVAFAGGYKVGQGSKRAAAATTAEDVTSSSTATAASSSGGETHALPADGAGSSTAAEQSSSAPAQDNAAADVPVPQPASQREKPEAPLGSRNREKPLKTVAQRDLESSGPAIAPAPVPGGAGFAPQTGQTFLQVAAVSPDEAEAIADVLRKKGFHAHAVPKPGTAKIYRVIIGPVRDASELNSTRASLRNTGFREIFVQRY